MKIFDFFFRRDEGQDSERPTMTISPSREDSCVFATIDWANTTPGDPSALDLRTRILFDDLKSLSKTDLVARRGDYDYIIPFVSIPEFEAELQNLLQLEPQQGWTTEVRLGGVIGRGDPDLHLIFSDAGGTYDVVGRELVTPVECGFWSNKRHELIVLPRPILELRDLIEKGPDNLSDNRQAAVFRFVARVKELALQAQEELVDHTVKIAEQLQNEEFVAAESAKIQVEPDNSGGLNLYPTVKGMEDEKSRRDLLEARQTKELFTRRTEDTTTRVALHPQTRREIHRVRQKRHIPPEDVADFARDPRSHIQPPEELAAEKREIAEALGIPLDEVEESPDFNPDLALDLEPVEKFLEDFDIRLYGDRVIGVEVDGAELPSTDSARTTSLGDWSGKESASAPATEAADCAAATHTDSEPDVDDPKGPEQTETGGTTPDPEASSVDTSAEGTSQTSESRIQGTSSTERTTAKSGKARLVTIDNDEETEFLIESREHLQRRFEDFGAPELFDGELRKPFQTEGYAWLRELHDMDDAGGLLADDMGMGKTVQVIALLSHLARNESLRPALLVVPKSTLQNWQNEIDKFCKVDLDCYEHLGGQRKRSANAIEKHDIVLTTYSTLRNDQLTLGEIRFSVMICDEAQKIKNYTTGQATACRAMNAGLRLALTATPVENGLIELWAILDFCQPGRLDSMASFKERFVEPIESADIETQDSASVQLLKRMDPHYIRRTKTQYLGDELPDKLMVPNAVSMTDVQRHKYDQVLDWYHSEEGSAFGAINAMLRICAHPDAIKVDTEKKIGLPPRPISDVLNNPEEIVERSGKFQFIVKKLREIQQQGERAILFSRQRTIQLMLKAVASHLFGLHSYLINGQIPAADRQSIVDEFNQSKGFNIIVLSPRAAGVGINVTGANHVFHVTREWNPAVEDQATDRAYRIGQKRDVYVYVPTTEYPDNEYQTMDQHLHQLLEEKRGIANSTVVPRGLGKVARSELEKHLR